MYALAVIASVATLNTCQILMRLSIQTIALSNCTIKKILSFFKNISNYLTPDSKLNNPIFFQSYEGSFEVEVAKIPPTIQTLTEFYFPL